MKFIFNFLYNIIVNNIVSITRLNERKNFYNVNKNGKKQYDYRNGNDL